MAEGLCRQTDPEVFFPVPGGSTREAKKVCADCEVRAECLDWALENRQEFGVWGGLGPEARQRLVRDAHQLVAS